MSQLDDGQAKNPAELEVEETLIESNKSAAVEPKKHKFLKELIGSGLVITSAFLLCLNVIFNKMAKTITPIDQLILRYIFQSIISFFVCKFYKINCFGNKGERKLLLIRGIFGVFVAFLTLIAVKLVHPSDFMTIINASVIITALICRLFIKEKLTIIHLFAVLLSIVGITCIFRPSFLFTKSRSIGLNFTANITNGNENDKIINEYTQFSTIIGIVASLGVAFAGAFSNLYMKLLSNAKVHFANVAIYPAYITLPIASIVSVVLVSTRITYKNFQSEKHLYLLHIFYSSMGGTCAALGTLILSLSFKYEDANKIALIRTTDVFFSFLLQFIILNIKIDLFGVIGAVLILSGTFCVVVFKLIEKNTQNKNKIMKGLTYKF